MSPLSIQGQVRIDITRAAGKIRTIAVNCERYHGLTPLLSRLPLEAVPAAIGRLHSLCGLSQRTAAAAALAAAGDRLAAPVSLARLAAERLGELLRSSLIDFATRVPPDTESKNAARALLATTTALAAGGTAAPGMVAAALDRLGLGAVPPPPDSWAGRALADVASLAVSEPLPFDPLVAADDAAVVEALAQAGETFAARPSLPGRRPQTGPLARAVARAAPLLAPLDAVARLTARFSEITAAASLLDSSEDAVEAGWLQAGCLAPGLGFAALESPRGRLYHLIGLDSGGRLARCHILAPTEWAFAPEGPFMAALARLRPPRGKELAVAIDRLAALYDPCVVRTISVTEVRTRMPRRA